MEPLWCDCRWCFVGDVLYLQPLGVIASDGRGIYNFDPSAFDSIMSLIAE